MELLYVLYLNGISALAASKHLLFSALTSPKQQNEWAASSSIVPQYFGSRVLGCIWVIISAHFVEKFSIWFDATFNVGASFMDLVFTFTMQDGI